MKKNYSRCHMVNSVTDILKYHYSHCHYNRNLIKTLRKLNQVWFQYDKEKNLPVSKVSFLEENEFKETRIIHNEAKIKRSELRFGR